MEHLKKCSIIFNVSSMNWKSLAEGENNFISNKKRKQYVYATQTASLDLLNDTFSHTD